MLNYLFWNGAAALLASVVIVAVARHWAQRKLLLDRPNDRSLHEHPTPRGGGIGIVVPVCFAIASVGVLVPEVRLASWWLAGAGVLVAAVGLVDDARGLSAVTRLVMHVLAAALVVIGIGTWRVVVWPGIGSVPLGWASIPLTLVFVVGLTNAYNFMDGSDGIAGTQGLVAGFGWVGVGYTMHDPLVAVAGTVTALASLGFLFFNWSPARVFMGDVGSAFLGFLLATLSVYVASKSPAAATAGILFVWPFVFDAVLTFLRRISRRENLLRAHRTHLYQRLVLTGVSHRVVAFLYGMLATVGVGVGTVVIRGAGMPSVAGALLIGILAACLWVGVVRREQTTGPSLRPNPSRRHS